MNILTTEDVKTLLKISDKKAKALMRTEGFPSIRIGQEYRVEEQALLDWIKSVKEVKLDYTKL
ncbi:MAG: helix-turn-helix domain-containing protein [Lachnospiraceae bacterium]|nr:helix-turn-helix domain-containing protein [Lachnospiraceae bacterium]